MRATHFLIVLACLLALAVVGCSALLGASFDDLPPRKEDPDAATDAGRDGPSELEISERDASPGDAALEAGDEDTAAMDMGRDARADEPDARADEPTVDAQLDGEAGDEVQPEGCPMPPLCTGDLSNIGTADFSIAFRLVTAATVKSAVLSQRGFCGEGPFWDIRLFPLTVSAAFLYLEFDRSSSVDYASLHTTIAVNDGAEHQVQICRTLGMISAFIDGKPAGNVPYPYALPQLAPLVEGTSVCSAGVDGTMPLAGTVSDVCVGQR